MAVAMSGGEQTPSVLLVFSSATPGDDAQVTERKRILAMLDLPRPEMIINAWVMQNSSANPKAMGAFSNAVNDLVAQYNSQVENVVLLGYNNVSEQMAKAGGDEYFDRRFYHYIHDRFVAGASSAPPAQGVQNAAQQFLDHSPATLADSPEQLAKSDICARERYCLGYDLFLPVAPRLTDLLLALIAARNPYASANQSIDAIEARPGGLQAPVDEHFCVGLPKGPIRDRCAAIWRNLDLGHEPRPPSPANCVSLDRDGMLRSLMASDAHVPRMQLECFREAAAVYLATDAPASGSPIGVGPLRAAVADFLFNYKMSQQYPHEFAWYELTQSADTLNATLSPLIDAFNRDVTTFQTFMRADLQYQVERLNNEHDERCCVKRLFGLDKPSFFNDGLVTVRTISGQWTYVNTTSRSFLDASSAPSLSTLLNNIAAPGASAAPNASPLAAALGTAAAAPGIQNSAALLSGVLNSYQTTYAQVGRSLQISVIPRSLSSASSAELAITLNADEAAGGVTYSGGPANGQQPNTSAVANHDTATRVRVQSLKLFDVSSFSAIVQRSRSRFPLLPPFVEIPYIGTFAGIPIPAAKEYHSSFAVISAMVVPTAADIGYGLHFTMDRVVDGDAGPCSYVKGSAGADTATPCRFRRAVSLRDLDHQPVKDYNHLMVYCLATVNGSRYFGSRHSVAPLRVELAAPDVCANPTFDSVPREYIE